MKNFMVLYCFILINGYLCINNVSELLKTIKIYYYNPIRETESNILELQDNNINFKNPIKLIIHGWMANYNHLSIQPLKNAYKLTPNITLLTVDYREIAALDYSIATKAVKKVGVEIARIVKKKFRLNMRDKLLSKNKHGQPHIHVLGHSLGAHIAGHVGKYFNGALDRITGLDAAFPFFPKQSPDSLKKNDAKFVDIIHTGGRTLGIFYPAGDIDFYVNGGIAPQPGCIVLDALTGLQCSHYRAPTFFAESVLLPWNFAAVPCNFSNIEAENDCLEKAKGKVATVFMGENTDPRSQGIYYLETNNVPPYGKGNNF